MSSIADIGKVLGVGQAQTTKKAEHSTNEKAGKDLTMDDYLLLMVETLKNQDMDNTADPTELMGQMVQMSVIQAITEITSVIQESSSLSYAASLVGKEVTIGQYEGKTLHEIVGVVTGTGTLNGQQVVFIDDDSYYLTDVMAVGRLPKEPDDTVPEDLTEKA